MSQGTSSDPASQFVFGTPEALGETTKPVPFTFSPNLPSEAEKPNGSKASTTQAPPRSTSPPVAPTPPPAQAEEKPEEQPEPQNVKAALKEELEHLQRTRNQSRDHEMRTAPLITREAYIAGGSAKMAMQYGVIGEALSIESEADIYEPIVDSRLYINTNTPFSALVCGVQGSGKSHTISVLLENMFIPKLNSIGTLSKPLAGLALHFDESGPGERPCEAAWIGVPSDANPHITTPPICVYVSRSSLNRMKAVYEPLGKNVTVMPLLFDESELDAEVFLSLMAGNTSASDEPMYMRTVLGIVQELGGSFSYRGFLRRLKEKNKMNFFMLDEDRLQQRLLLLDSFVDTCSSRHSLQFSAGELTIVDLSDPSVDIDSACGIFRAVIRLFVRADVGTGKVLAVDEAHKYLSPLRRVTGLAKSLLTLTREQRHLGMRVLISTQEPTIVPHVLLGLCTVVIVHRFSSPAWWNELSSHVSAGGWVRFDRVVKLQPGEAIVLAPSAMGVFPDRSATEAGKTPLTLGQFEQRVILMKTRARVTKDNGASVLVVDPELESQGSKESS